MSYMFIHDGLVHRRFPVGPIAEVPYLKRVAIAHKLHHSEKYDGVPWGLFLGPQVSEALPPLHQADVHSLSFMCRSVLRLGSTGLTIVSPRGHDEVQLSLMMLECLMTDSFCTGSLSRSRRLRSALSTTARKRCFLLSKTNPHTDLRRR